MSFKLSSHDGSARILLQMHDEIRLHKQVGGSFYHG